MLKFVQHSFERTPAKFDSFYPLHTQTTADAQSRFRYTYSNESFGNIEAQHNLRGQTLFQNESAVSFTNAEIPKQDIDDLLNTTILINFISQQIRANNLIIRSKQALIQNVKVKQIQEEESKVQLKKSLFDKNRISLMKKKQKLTADRKERRIIINKDIEELKKKIHRMKNCRHEYKSVGTKNERNNSAAQMKSKGFQTEHKKAHSHRRVYTYSENEPERNNSHNHRRKIYVPIMSLAPSFQPQYQYWNSPYPYVRSVIYQQQLQPNHPPNQQILKCQTQHSEDLDNSFTQRINVFSQKLQNALQKQRSSDMENSSTRRKKTDYSIKDKGSYIYPSIRNSNSSASKSKLKPKISEQIKFLSEDEEHNQKLFIQKRKSLQHNLDKQIIRLNEVNLQHHQDAFSKKIDKKSNSIPTIEEINNSTVYVEVGSEKRENSSFEKDIQKRQNQSDKQSEKKKPPEQSDIHFDTKLLEYLMSSPIRQSPQLRQSPFRIKQKEEMLGQSVQFHPSQSYRTVEHADKKNIQSVSFPFNEENSVSSKYEDTPRKKEKSSKDGGNRSKNNKNSEQNIEQQRKDSFLKVININPVAKLGSKVATDKKQSVQQNDEDDFLNTIKLSTQSIISRERKSNTSGVSQIKIIPEEKMVSSFVELKESKRSKTSPIQRDQIDEVKQLEEMRTSTPSRIVKTNLVKRKFKAESQLMNSSIQEANEEQQDAASSSKILKKSKNRASNLK